VITTLVTTGLITRIGQHFDAQVINDLLVGFKYHADVLAQLESSGQYGDVRGQLDDFIIATEESHGVLVTPEIRDKDSAGAALLLAEAALTLKRRQSTLPAYLADIYRRFGYFRNALRNIALSGIEGKYQLNRMMDHLRRSPPTAIAGWKVSHFGDLLDENGRLGPIKGETDRAARNFLVFFLQGDHEMKAKICMRPSGTEPKAKAYFEVSTPACPPHLTDAEWNHWQQLADQAIAQLADEFLQLALGSTGRTH